MFAARSILALVCVVALAVGCGSNEPSSAPAAQPGDRAQADAVRAAVRELMAAEHLRAVIVRVTVDGRDILTEAFGESMTGVPATADMHFRNGSVAIPFVANLLLQQVDAKKVRLTDKVRTWLPDLPNGDQVTLGQLAQMTSGYRDYVLGNQAFDAALYRDPFKNWTPEELIGGVVREPPFYPPGTNWNYAHTNYVILGLALEKITGQKVDVLMKEKVLDPLGLSNTVGSQLPVIPQPVLHAFTSERRAVLGVPAGTPFYEESTYWNPSWSITNGAVQTTNITDMASSAVAVGTGKLLSPESFRAMVSTELRGKTRTQPDCPTCFDQNEHYTYGLGIVITGNWLLQNPQLTGYTGAMAYLPSKKIAIAVAATYQPEAFDGAGLYSNSADTVFRRIGAILAPDEAPPTKR